MPGVHRLTPEQAASLAGQSFTYGPVGATQPSTAVSTFPPGFHHLRVELPVGRGDADFVGAAEALMTWGMHAGAGMRVATSSPRAVEGALVLCRLGPLSIPCRVVWVVDEPDARGFGYGTLPGHPESGEEAFMVSRDGDTVTLTVWAYSRRGLLLTRIAGPVGRLGQRLMIRRYAAALRRATKH